MSFVVILRGLWRIIQPSVAGMGKDAPVFIRGIAVSAATKPSGFVAEAQVRGRDPPVLG